MFFVVQSEERPEGWAFISTSNAWAVWLNANIPQGLSQNVRRLLKSNLKHIITGMELKAALVQPHHDEPGVLFEPYYQNFISEFCVATFSVLEGLGSAHWLDREGLSGEGAPHVGTQQWVSALCEVYDSEGEYSLAEAVERTRVVRNKLHQDKVGAREDIDWHAFSFEGAFLPAKSGMGVLLLNRADLVPDTTNLR